MSIFNRFFGRKEESTDAGKLAANPEVKNSLALTVLFAARLAIDANELTKALRAYHPTMRGARVELLSNREAPFGLVGWKKHVVKMVGFDVPMPKESVEDCVAPSHYSPEMKAQVRAHLGHIILYYAGFEEDPLEQYVALAAVAGALVEFDAVGVLNEKARTSVPGVIFTLHAELGCDSLEGLRDFPLTMMFCGFVKYEVEGVQGVWMRTYGAGALGCNDLATLAEGHHEGEKYSDLFSSVLRYQLDSGAEFAAGHTMQVGEATYAKLREPLESEYFLHDPQKALVVEMITEAQINR